jgi:hypothetical protein
MNVTTIDRTEEFIKNLVKDFKPQTILEDELKKDSLEYMKTFAKHYKLAWQHKGVPFLVEEFLKGKNEQKNLFE